MDRISRLCSYLLPCKIFADVACDHGYCAEYMLKNGLCVRAVISDISEKSLSKAQTLLSEYIKSGKCRAVVCDGLEGVDCQPDEVLIAGIGGEEIVKILKNAYIPETFVFQPMKNARVLREYLLSEKCEISVDDIFTDSKKYYFIIRGCRFGKLKNYSEEELKYGRDSLKNKVFYDYLSGELEKKKSYLKREMSAESRRLIQADIAFMEEVLKGEAYRNTKNS